MIGAVNDATAREILLTLDEGAAVCPERTVTADAIAIAMTMRKTDRPRDLEAGRDPVHQHHDVAGLVLLQRVRGAPPRAP